MASDDTGFRVGDKVVQAETPGPKGIVQKVRRETTRTSLKEDTGEKGGITVSVLWDNGTLSHFIPEGLKKA